MASVVKLGNEKNPQRRIDFIGPDRNRKHIRLGRLGHDDAREVCRNVERLVEARTFGQTPAQALLAWLAELPDWLHERIARTGIIEPREPVPDAPTLGAFLEKHTAQRKTQLKPSSIERLGHTVAKLKTYFGEQTLVDQITPDGAKDWRAAIASDGLAEATVRLHCRNAKSIFTDLVDRELIRRNPFAKLKSAAIAARRDHFVSSEQTAKLLKNCPDLQWTVLIGLARYAGLRCPSETHGVTWRDVDWSQHRLTVYAPKTNKIRVMPILPSLYVILQQAFDQAEEGSTTILTLSRNNLRRQFLAILKSAGIAPWPNLFQTLRQSCETDLAKHFPQHAVSNWIGHSMKVSEQHYLQMTDDLYELAAKLGQDEESAAECAAVGSGTPSHGATNKGDDKCDSVAARRVPKIKQALAICQGRFQSEADENRTRNLRIDSPVL